MRLPSMAGAGASVAVGEPVEEEIDRAGQAKDADQAGGEAGAGAEQAAASAPGEDPEEAAAEEDEADQAEDDQRGETGLVGVLARVLENGANRSEGRRTGARRRPHDRFGDPLGRGRGRRRV